MTIRLFYAISLVLAFSLCTKNAIGQLEKITIDLQKDKPEKFKNRKLRSEKTGEKKLSLTGRFIQNSVSHYNYYFNANNKIESVIEKARISQKDDYTRLLPYYSYSLDNTASQNIELDSVIQKATAGLLLHDLRSNWVDNFYLLIGKAYYLEKKFDSAYMAFQFINYHLAPKSKKDNGVQTVVGSNSNQAAGSLSIASKEDRNLIQKTFSLPPSRNDALLWQIRVLTDMKLYAEAAGLINTLKNDPNLPKRLDSYLSEVTGYWFYQQKMYDSAIQYIELSLPNAIDLQDQARKEFLLAQLYDNKKSLDTAYEYYSLAIRHTTDPLLDIYANLNRAKLLYSEDAQEIKNSIAQLIRMSRKDKYHDYRHIVYYAAGELAMEIPDTLSAIAFYKSSAHFNQNDIALKNKAFLTLADISYERHNYKDSYAYYDSLKTGDTTLHNLDKIKEKKVALSKIIKEINIIEREDSLQLIAAMPTAERDAYLKKLSRKLKKEQGISDDDYIGGNASDAFKKGDDNIDLFSQNSNAKGDWYFYNAGMKSRGFSDFKREWGNRQNIDNWRRITGQPTSVTAGKKSNIPSEMAPDTDPMAARTNNSNEEPEVPEQTDITVEGLKANLPLTQPLLDSSNQRIAIATFALGKNYQLLLEDYKAAINTYQLSLHKFPDSLYNGELYMNLSYCYKQLGNTEMAEKYKRLLINDFRNSEFAQNILHPERFDPKVKDSIGTSMYNTIYTQFIEGNFEQAIADKKIADSIYGKTHWNPQLLYIESIYYIKQREDSAAITTLKNIIKEYPASPMKDKAENMIRILSKRDSIENYLTHLKVERLPEDSQIVVFDDTRIYGNLPQKLVRNDSNLLPRKITTVDIPELKEEKKLPPPVKNKNFVIDINSAQNVVMILTKVDPVYVSEARNALIRYTKTKFYNRNIEIKKDALDADRSLLVFEGFINADDAIQFVSKIRHDIRGEISWLPSDKYTFYIISNDNLELLKENKNLESYLDLLRKSFPGKF